LDKGYIKGYINFGQKLYKYTYRYTYFLYSYTYLYLILRRRFLSGIDKFIRSK